MAVTPLQSAILTLLAQRRKAEGESYIAGGVALNIRLASRRRSRDIDLFHDTEEALAHNWEIDRADLLAAGYRVDVLREAPSFVEALVADQAESTVMQWARDSAFRFFPLVEDDQVGLVLHPFDLATNKVLAMAGRLEVRDWVDVIRCNDTLQPLGYLAWAACGKDPGYNPRSLLAAARRLHYSQPEVDTLDFEGPRPDAAELGRKWHRMLQDADAACAGLPPEETGKAVLNSDGSLFKGGGDGGGTPIFHAGSIGGAWPTVKPAR